MSKIETEYIIVGLGISGIAFSNTLERNNKSFVVFDNNEPQATGASGGIVNPVILKRFLAVANSESYYPKAKRFYKNLENTLDTKIYEEKPVYRIFKSIAEQNNWIAAGDLKRNKNYLRSEILSEPIPNILTPFGYGEVKNVIQLQVSSLLANYKKRLHDKNLLISHDFDYNTLQVQEDSLNYEGLRAKKIVFFDGPQALKNPYFPADKLIPNKGEYIIIKAPLLKLNALIKGPHYIIPLGEDTYKVGATFDRNNASWKFSEQAHDNLVSALSEMITCPFNVVGYSVGVRATTADRKALIGTLSSPRIGFLNGLGSHGFLSAPLLSEQLFEHMDKEKDIPEEVNIKRTIV